MTVFLVGAGSMVEGKTSPGLNGSYTVQAGLVALLAGTGLMAFQQADGSYELRQAFGSDASASTSETTLPTVTVVSAAGYEQDARNAPASISVITSQDLEKRQFSSLQDIAREEIGRAHV